LVAAAEKALAGLNVKDFQNLKALKTPPKDIVSVFECVLHLLVEIDPKVPHAKGKLKAESSWKVALSLMGNPQAFLDQLNAFKEKIDSEKVPALNFKQIKPITSQDFFTPEIIKGKSGCAAGLCDWVVNIAKYYDVFVSVEPLKNSVRDATNRLNEANEKKAEMDELVADLTEKLAVLEKDF
jgi:dynein heavy chain